MSWFQQTLNQGWGTFLSNGATFPSEQANRGLIPVAVGIRGKSGQSNKCEFYSTVDLALTQPGKQEAFSAFKDISQLGRNTQGVCMIMARFWVKICTFTN